MSIVFEYEYVDNFQIRMDESQERETTQLAERLQHELEILTAYQSKSKMSLIMLANYLTSRIS